MHQPQRRGTRLVCLHPAVQPVQAPSSDDREAQEQHTGEERLVRQPPEQAIEQVQASKRDESQAQFWQEQTWQQTQEGEQQQPCEVRDHFRSVLIERCPEEDGQEQGGREWVPHQQADGLDRWVLIASPAFTLASQPPQLVSSGYTPSPIGI
jgi:hypothetical protein